MTQRVDRGPGINVSPTCPDDEILCYGCFIKCIHGHKNRIIWSKTNLLNNQYSVLYKIIWDNAVYIKNIFCKSKLCPCEVWELDFMRVYIIPSFFPHVQSTCFDFMWPSRALEHHGIRAIL